MVNHDDMESPSREAGWYRKRGAHHSMHTDGGHHYDMYIGVEFKFEKRHVLPPSELAGFLSLNYLVGHHLWMIHISSFPLQNWRGFPV